MDPGVRQGAEAAQVGSVMSTVVVCVPPSLPVDELMATFTRNRIGCAPVVDDQDALVGIVSKTDLVRARQAEIRAPTAGPSRLLSSTVAELMSPRIYALRRETPIARAAAIFAYEAIHHAPVVDAHQRIIGMVSSLDLLRWLAISSGYSSSPLHHR